MEANLPTTPGPYWWREKDGDKWEIKIVEQTKSGRGIWFSVRKLGGQWAKAHNPDEGIEAWVVFNNKGIICTCPDSLNATEYSQSVFNRMCLNRPYTCEPVTIYRKEKE